MGFIHPNRGPPGVLPVGDAVAWRRRHQGDTHRLRAVAARVGLRRQERVLHLLGRHRERAGIERTDAVPALKLEDSPVGVAAAEEELAALRVAEEIAGKVLDEVRVEIGRRAAAVVVADLVDEHAVFVQEDEISPVAADADDLAAVLIRQLRVANDPERTEDVAGAGERRGQPESEGHAGIPPLDGAVTVEPVNARQRSLVTFAGDAVEDLVVARVRRERRVDHLLEAQLGHLPVGSEDRLGVVRRGIERQAAGVGRRGPEKVALGRVVFAEDEHPAGIHVATEGTDVRIADVAALGKRHLLLFGQGVAVGIAPDGVGRAGVFHERGIVCLRQRGEPRSVVLERLHRAVLILIEEAAPAVVGEFSALV